MKRLVPILFLVMLAACVREPELPIGSGTYQFKHKFAEHPSMPSIDVTVTIEGRQIKVVNERETSVFPEGIIAEGVLYWHPGSRQWIIGDSQSDREAAEVGGCSDGPEVVDLIGRVYWTC